MISPSSVNLMLCMIFSCLAMGSAILACKYVVYAQSVKEELRRLRYTSYWQRTERKLYRLNERLYSACALGALITAEYFAYRLPELRSFMVVVPAATFISPIIAWSYRARKAQRRLYFLQKYRVKLSRASG